MTDSADEPELCWSRLNPERWLGLRGGRYTAVNHLLAMILGLALTLVFYGALSLVPKSLLAQMFVERGPTPYVIVFMSSASLVILAIKWRKVAAQRLALAHSVVPNEPDFVLSGATVDQVVARIYSIADDPTQFLLYDRILVALANLRNLGRVADVDDILRSQADNQEASIETSYSVVHGFVWAIPVLGFIGTVLGLSEAIGGFGAVLGSANDLAQITDALRGVTAGLRTAFDTTLEALVAALFIQMAVIFLKKSEQEHLDACAQYCLRNIVNRLRVLPFEGGEE